MSSGPVAANVGTEPEVFVDRKLRERPAALGHVCDPDAGDRLGPPGKPLAREDELAARFHRRRDRAQRRRLAGAVGAEDGDDLALVDGEVDSAQRLQRPVARGDAAQLKQGHAVGARYPGTPRFAPRNSR